MTVVTKRQRNVLDFIQEFVAVNRYSPSFQEIADGLGLKSLATVHKHVSNLRDKGWLTKLDDAHKVVRSLEISQPFSMGTRFKARGDRLWDEFEKCYWVREKDVKQ